MGRYFDGLHLPDGDVSSTTPTLGCVPQMIVTSNQPKLFVIPNDRDFQRVLADPITFHTRYLLAPDPTRLEPGAVNQLYPSLWRTGAGFTKMVHQFRTQSTSACPDFRLFHVLGHPNRCHSQADRRIRLRRRFPTTWLAPAATTLA